MELRTYDDFEEHWFKPVYAFDTEIQYADGTRLPYFDFVKCGELVCTLDEFSDKKSRYEIRKTGWDTNVSDGYSRIYGIEVDWTNGITKGNNIKIFTDEKEANEFADKYRKDHEKDLEEICNYVLKCTVTRLQIAEKFGIPVNDLVIDLYS